MPKPTQFISVPIEISMNTERAVRVRYEDAHGERRHEWLPLSQVRDIDLYTPEEQDIQIAKWLAEEKEMI